MKIKRKAILFGTILILSACIFKHHSSAQSQNPSKRAPISNDSSDIFLNTIDSADAEAIKNGYFQEARLDFDGDGKKEKLMILLYPFHENGTETIQNRLYISKKKSGGEITWQVYDPAADLKTGFSAYLNTTIDRKHKKISLLWKDTGKKFLQFPYEEWLEEPKRVPVRLHFLTNTKIEIEQGKIYLSVPFSLIDNKNEEWPVPYRLKMEIKYQDTEPHLILASAEQLDFIVSSKDQKITVYGTSPETTYQNMVLTADGQRYDLGLQWHTDYGETDIKQADYDGDGQQETAFFYPYGGGDGASNGLLVIDRDNNKNLFWTDLFPYQAWSDGSIEKQCRKLLNCSLDKKKNCVKITDRKTGKKLLRIPYDKSQIGEDDKQIKDVFLSSQASYKLTADKIYMECHPALLFKNRVTPYPLDAVLRLEVIYRPGKSAKLKFVGLKNHR